MKKTHEKGNELFLKIVIFFKIKIVLTTILTETTTLRLGERALIEAEGNVNIIGYAQKDSSYDCS